MVKHQKTGAKTSTIVFSRGAFPYKTLPVSRYNIRPTAMTRTTLQRIKKVIYRSH